MNIEQSVIGCILLDSEKALKLAINEGLSRDWFEQELHRRIYDIVMDQFRCNRFPDSRTVDTELASQKLEMPTQHYLDDCVDAVVTAAHFPHYIELLRGLYHHRRMRVELSGELEELKRLSPDKIPESVARISTLLNEINDGQNHNERTLSEVAVNLIETWKLPPDRRGCLSWGLPELDDKLGMITNEYICVAAQESQGKTALALQIAAHIAKQGRRASLRSLESRMDQIVSRLIALLGQVNTLDLRTGKGRKSQFDSAIWVSQVLTSLPLAINDRPANTDQLRSWAMNEKGLGSVLLILDNLKHIMPARQYHSLPDMFRDFSLQMKWIRDQTNLPFIVLHHLNKDDDVSWSRDLRRDVDILLFIKADEKRTQVPCFANEYIGKWYVNIEVVKNRDGQSGFEIPLEFDKYVQTFRSEKPPVKTIQEDGLE